MIYQFIKRQNHNVLSRIGASAVFRQAINLMSIHLWLSMVYWTQFLQTMDTLWLMCEGDMWYVIDEFKVPLSLLRYIEYCGLLDSVVMGLNFIKHLSLSK